LVRATGNHDRRREESLVWGQNRLLATGGAVAAYVGAYVGVYIKDFPASRTRAPNEHPTWALAGKGEAELLAQDALCALRIRAEPVGEIRPGQPAVRILLGEARQHRVPGLIHTNPVIVDP